MIKLEINGENYQFFESYSIDLRFDAIASSISFSAFFDADSPTHKKLFKPFSYNSLKVYFDSTLLLTGYIVSHTFPDSNKPEPVAVSGYSKTGVLEDCKIHQDSYPLQYANLSLLDIVKKLCKPYDIEVIYDDEVEAIVNASIVSETAKETDTVKEYLASICNQRNVVLTHNEKGQIVLTKAKAAATPIDSFTTSKLINPTLSTNGQGMFKTATIMRQAGLDEENAGQSVVENPFVSITRSTTIVQTSGDNSTIEDTAKDVLSKQLKSISFNFSLRDIFYRNGSLVLPNNVILIKNKQNYLYNYTKFFVERVTLNGNSKGNTADLKCVIPEVYTKETPINIFE